MDDGNIYIDATAWRRLCRHCNAPTLEVTSYYNTSLQHVWSNVAVAILTPSGTQATAKKQNKTRGDASRATVRPNPTKPVNGTTIAVSCQTYHALSCRNRYCCSLTRFKGSKCSYGRANHAGQSHVKKRSRNRISAT